MKTDTKAYPIQTIVSASEALDRAHSLLQAIDALRPKDTAPLDAISIAAGLAVEAIEIITEVQHSLLGGKAGETA